MLFPLRTRIYVSVLASLLAAAIIVIPGCGTNGGRTDKPDKPMHILWAWERPENLLWISKGDSIGVAFLAQTITIKGEKVEVGRRLQELRVSPDTYLIAVTRIETGRDGNSQPSVSDAQVTQVRESIVATSKLKGVSEIQIDFDAAVSERAVYTELLKQIKSVLPAGFPITMTALASWCSGDRWISNLPVDEAVPMIFDMGTDDKKIRGFLQEGKDWREPLCRKSYGLAVYENIKADFDFSRKFYYFNNRPWKESDKKFFIEEK